MDNGHVKFKVALEAVIDAKGVFTSIENEDTKVPAESSRLSSVQAARKAFVERRLKTLYWCVTRDMVSDGLTNGSVDGAEFIRRYQENIWKSVDDKPVSVSLCVIGAELFEQTEPEIWHEDDKCFYSQWATARLGHGRVLCVVARLPISMVK